MSQNETKHYQLDADEQGIIDQRRAARKAAEQQPADEFDIDDIKAGMSPEDQNRARRAILKAMRRE